MKRLLLPILWFPMVFLTLIISFLFYNYRSTSFLNEVLAKESKDLGNKRTAIQRLYNSIPKVMGASAVDTEIDNSVFSQIEKYLIKYKSPMKGTSKHLIETTRNYDIDPYLLIAIAQCETNLGKKTKENCFNPFGIGVHSKGTLCFDNWELSYEKMAKTLKEDYIDIGLVSVEQIMHKYCPNSVKDADGHWAKCVNRFKKEVENLN